MIIKTKATQNKTKELASQKSKKESLLKKTAITKNANFYNEKKNA